MGLLYTTEGTRNILDTLNTAFSGPNSKDKGLKYIRDAMAKDSKLQKMVEGRKWNAGHLAWSLQLLPFNQASKGVNNAHTRRWAYFLKRVVGTQQFKDLKDALAEVILNQDMANKNFVSVSFDHVEIEETDTATLVIFDQALTDVLVNRPYVRHITLFTKRLKDFGNDEDFDKPDSDDADYAKVKDAPWNKP